MKIARLAAATAVAALMTAGAASAMTLKFDGWANGSVNVKVKTPELDNPAGAFKMKDTSTKDSFVVFCLDIIGKIYSGKTYNYKTTSTPFANSIDLIANGGVGRVQALFDSGYKTALNSSITSAGFQVALWNAVYDKDWSVSSGAGTFYAKSTSNASVTEQANKYLLAASTYGGSKEWNLTYLEGYNNTNTDGSRAQNLVTMAPVPLPAAGLMLLGALGGLAGLRRRRKAA